MKRSIFLSLEQERRLTDTRHALANHEMRGLPLRALARLGVIPGYPDKQDRLELYRREMGTYARLSDGITGLVEATNRAIKNRRTLLLPKLSLLYDKNVTPLFVPTDNEVALVRDMAKREATIRSKGGNMRPDLFNKVGGHDILRIGFAALRDPDSTQKHVGQRYPEATMLAFVARLNAPDDPEYDVAIDFSRETMPAYEQLAPLMERAIDRTIDTH